MLNICAIFMKIGLVFFDKSQRASCVTNNLTNEQTNEHARLQYLLAEIMIKHRLHIWTIQQVHVINKKLICFYTAKRTQHKNINHRIHTSNDIDGKQCTKAQIHEEQSAGLQSRPRPGVREPSCASTCTPGLTA